MFSLAKKPILKLSLNTSHVTFADKIITFTTSLSIESPLPEGVGVMNPYQDAASLALAKHFYEKYYSDLETRILILGINPGRFGGGITGIPFTDPVKLEQNCGIHNDLPKKPELSADFIYRMITAYGGPEKFYRHFFISAVSPLGFIKGGKNLNYYDIKELQESLHDFILTNLKRQLDFGINREVCYCLGEGKNFKFITHLNNQHSFFREIVPLAHPRFIMQYKRKKVDAYVTEYVRSLRAPAAGKG